MSQVTKVDSDVQSVVDTANFIYQALLNLWAMTPIELQMYLIGMFIVSILMQYYKKSFLTQCTKKEKVKKLWAISFPLGVVLSAIGVYIYGDAIHIGYFVLTGLTVSTVSMGVYRSIVDYVWPFLRMVFKAIADRIMLFVRGAPKDEGS